ncbi:MAG: hypothetical protein ACJ741_06560 [Pyrinomonadaceae bacterium]
MCDDLKFFDENPTIDDDPPPLHRHTVVVARVPPGTTAGDVLRADGKHFAVYSPGGLKRGSTRPLRWYERLWAWARRWARDLFWAGVEFGARMTRKR